MYIHCLSSSHEDSCLNDFLWEVPEVADGSVWSFAACAVRVGLKLVNTKTGLKVGTSYKVVQKQKVNKVNNILILSTGRQEVLCTI